MREWVTRQPVDLILSTMGFPLVGGPAGSTKPGHYQQKASDLLAGIDVPYIIAQPLQMQSEHEWHAQGVAPMQAVIMYDLPEMDGSIAPVTLGAMPWATDRCDARPAGTHCSAGGWLGAPAPYPTSSEKAGSGAV